MILPWAIFWVLTFLILAVVGIAGIIRPLAVAPVVLSRDMLVMAGLTLFLFIVTYGFRGVGRISRIEGVILLVCYLSYIGYLASATFHGHP